MSRNRKINSANFARNQQTVVLYRLQSLVHEKTIELLLEPLLGLILGHLVVVANATAALLAAGDTGTGAVQMDEEIHTVDTGGRIVLDTKIDVLLDTEAEAAGLGEVLVEELVFLNLKTLLEDLLSLLATDGDVAGDLLVTTDGEGADGVTSAGEHRLLFGELLQHTGSTGQSIARFTNANVQDELVDLDVSHRILFLFRHDEKCGCIISGRYTMPILCRFSARSKIISNSRNRGDVVDEAQVVSPQYFSFTFVF